MTFRPSALQPIDPPRGAGEHGRLRGLVIVRYDLFQRVPLALLQLVGPVRQSEKGPVAIAALSGKPPGKSDAQLPVRQCWGRIPSHKHRPEAARTHPGWKARITSGRSRLMQAVIKSSGTRPFDTRSHGQGGTGLPAPTSGQMAGGDSSNATRWLRNSLRRPAQPMPGRSSHPAPWLS